MSKPPLATAELSCLPTLTDLEDALRSTQAGKPTGFDDVPSGFYRRLAPQAAEFYYDLIWKVFVWRSEPITFKGGRLAVIPKKGDMTLAKNYRGILLLPSVPKRLHAILRARLMKKLNPVRLPGQLGGFPQQQVTFGSQTVRSFTNVLGKLGFSTAVLFVDLSEAFHRLIRELVTGTGKPTYVDTLLTHLASDGQPIEGLKECLEQPDILFRIACDPLLQELAQDIHYHTWYKIGKHPLTCTKRGTRPGSPLADIIFHCLMHDIQKDLHDWLLHQGDFVALCDEAGVEPLQVIWSDDLAIPWATREACQLPQAMGDLLEKVRDLFESRGFKLNLAKNKTSVVATFRGKGAPLMRRELILSGQGGHKVIFQDKSEHWLHYLNAYKHLGTYYTADHDLSFELRYRLGMARSAFVTLAKPVFCNRRIPVHIRFRLFQSLVESKLYFGCGAWPTPQPQLMKKLSNAVAIMCRRIGKWLNFSDGATQSQIFTRSGVTEPRIVLARERLRYAMRIGQHGSEDFIRLLHLDRVWLDGLEADIRWLRTVSYAPDDVPQSFEEIRQLGLANPKRWRNLIKQGIRRHQLQEACMQEAHALHRNILSILRNGGAAWSPDPFAIQSQDRTYECPCGRSFSTPQGLSSHKRLAHNIFSLEHQFLAGATCPSCHTYLWTTQRQQHLAYVPRGTGINLCYHDLKERNFFTEYDPVKSPASLRGINRIDALTTAGPFLPPDAQDVERKILLQTELDELETQEAQSGTFCLDDDLAVTTFRALDECTARWLEAFQAGGHRADLTPSLQEQWSEVLQTRVPTRQEHSDVLFLHWGNRILPEVMATWMDGQAEEIVDTDFYKMAHELPRSCRMVRMQTIRRLLAPRPSAPRLPHRPTRRGSAKCPGAQDYAGNNQMSLPRARGMAAGATAYGMDCALTGQVCASP